MKANIVWLVLAWSLVTGSRAQDKPLDLVFNDAPVELILRALANYQQINLVIAPGVTGNISLRLKGVKWQYAVKLIAEVADVEIIQEQQVLKVYPGGWRLGRKAQKQPTTDTVVSQAIALHHVKAEVILPQLEMVKATLMTEIGMITADNRTNSLLLRDTPSSISKVLSWINMVDVPIAQIELVAHIVTISQEHLQELGVNWGLAAEDMPGNALRNPFVEIPLSVEKPTGRIGVTLARFDARLLSLELSALEQENQIDIIASPRLITQHQQTATIRQGTEIPYEVASGNNGGTAVQFKDAMLEMKITPEVKEKGRIELKLNLSQNMPGRNLRTSGAEILTINKQEIETQVILKDGQTLAVGGIFQQQTVNGERRVPFLSHLPGIGALFRHKVSERNKRELVIFITPRLISAPTVKANAIDTRRTR